MEPDFFTAIPKSDLHRHLTATIRPNLLLFLIKKNDSENFNIIQEKIDEIFNFSSAKGFFNTHSLVRSYIRDLYDFSTLAKEAVTQLETDNIQYTEFLFSPQFFTEKGFILKDMIETLHQEFKKSKNPINLIIEFSRARGSNSAEQTFNELKLLLDDKCGQIIKGISIGGDEINFSAKPFNTIYQQARNHGLKTTAHAGEWIGPESIWEVLHELQVDRIIHGITALKDEALISYLRATNIPLDVSISSNYATGAVPRNSLHPIRELVAKEINILVSTDIPGYLQISQSSEFKKLMKIGFTKDNIVKIVQNTISASFASYEEKDLLTDTLTKFNDMI